MFAPLLSLAEQDGGAEIARVPLDEKTGAPVAAAARRLLSPLYFGESGGGGAMGQLVALLCRVEDLSHVLLWTDPMGAGGDGGSGGGDGGGGGGGGAGGGGGGGGGGGEEAALGRVELPRLRLSFEVERSAATGATRLCSVESPGLHVGWLEGTRAAALLTGLPHALVMLNDDGDAFVLLSALAKPCAPPRADSPPSASDDAPSLHMHMHMHMHHAWTDAVATPLAPVTGAG